MLDFPKEPMVSQTATFDILEFGDRLAWNRLQARCEIKVVEVSDKAVPGVAGSEFSDPIPPKLVRVVEYLIPRALLPQGGQNEQRKED